MEPNLKKIPHRYRIWGLEANSMKFHLPISKKSVFVAPERKITKPRFGKWNHWTDEIFSIISEKSLLNKVCSPYPLCIIKFFFRPILRQKTLADFSNFSPKIFGPKLAEKKILLGKVGMGKKLYLINFFHLLLKKFRPFSDFTFESEVSWFFSQGLRKRIFLRLVGETT